MSTGCMICDDKVAMRAIDEELVKGLTYSATARLMTLRGFEVSAATVSSHDKHRAVSAGPKSAVKQKRDAALIIKNRVLDAIEADSELNILDKDLQPSLSTALKAQAIEDKREAKKVTQNFWFELGGSIFDVPLLADPTVIEGESRDVTDE